MLAKIMLVLAVFGLIGTLCAHGLTVLGDWLAEQGMVFKDFGLLVALFEMVAEFSAFCVISSLMIAFILALRKTIFSRFHKIP